MTKAIPKWLMIRYAALYRELDGKKFDRVEAITILTKYNLNKDEKLTNMFFSDLAKLGWMDSERDQEDKRKKVYKLIKPEKAIKELELD